MPDNVDKKSVPFVEVPNPSGVGSICREATRDEIRVAEGLRGKIAAQRHALECAEAELERSLAQCDHRLIFDTPGFAYDIRMCWVCGATRGLI